MEDSQDLTRSNREVLLGAGCMLLATVLKGWHDVWPLEAWIVVPVVLLGVLCVVWMDTPRALPNGTS